MAETVRALLFSAEQQAHEDQWGNFIPLRGPLDALAQSLSQNVPADGGDPATLRLLLPYGDAD